MSGNEVTPRIERRIGHAVHESTFNVPDQFDSIIASRGDALDLEQLCPSCTS